MNFLHKKVAKKKFVITILESNIYGKKLKKNYEVQILGL
ncbi:MAG: hypothetical protein UW45_C0014G0018 [Parcubacteria group bacterium GW2011_GWC2_44_22]|nr:MAG: hypothetical protein UW45_C0014G0018 [Parcubacteria group bacterium GW2011_GWC2_44_22]